MPITSQPLSSRYPDSLQPGMELSQGKYCIEGILGQGGFGITYQGILKLTHGKRAIKEFYPQGSYRDREGNVNFKKEEEYEKKLNRFIREAKILEEIQHPNVVSIRDLFLERNTAYLVMDFIEGQSLAQYRRYKPERKLDLPEVRSFFQMLVNALSAVHRKNIYHLDLKPENILITHEKSVILIDFGGARQQGQHSSYVRTPGYEPPEVLMGQEVGAYSDVFQLGTILYEILVGRLPSSYSLEAMKEIEMPWQTLIQEARHFHKEDRPQTVDEWWQIAESYWGNQFQSQDLRLPIPAEPVKPPEQLPLSSSQSPVPSTLSQQIDNFIYESKPYATDIQTLPSQTSEATVSSKVPAVHAIEVKPKKNSILAITLIFILGTSGGISYLVTHDLISSQNWINFITAQLARFQQRPPTISSPNDLPQVTSISPGPIPTSTPTPTPVPSPVVRLPTLPCNEPSLKPLGSDPDLVLPDGTKLYGEIKNGQLVGRGTSIRSSGVRYDAEFSNNLANGCGRLNWPVDDPQYPTQEYIGQFKDNNLDGLGILLFKNGDRYVGEFETNKCQGEGVFILAHNNERIPGVWDKSESPGKPSCLRAP